MAILSAGLLPYRINDNLLEVLIVHPGGPFWAKRDNGVWSLAKGEYLEGEDPLHAAKREFKEETGQSAPEGEYLDLGELKQPSGKIIKAWAVKADIDVLKVKSNTFEMAWPPKSSRLQTFPEVDKAAWCSIGVAKARLLKGQVSFLDELVGKLNYTGPVTFITDTDIPIQPSLF